MNERARILALQLQVSELQRENAALRLAAAKIENVVLQKSVDDLTAEVATLTTDSTVTVK
ncbi:MAG: hypothetical protein ACTS5G_01005 [Burkholderiales bacterium]